MTWWLPHTPTFFNGRVQFTQGEMLEVLRGLPDNHFDSVVCDPPYHLTSITDRFGKDGAAPAQFGKDGAFSRASKGFMGKTWDGGDVAFRVETWAEVLRVLKPGGYILAFSSSRTFGRMSVALEDAGFITHPMIGWIFGSGFPKAHNLSKQLDKDAGAERKVVAQLRIKSGGTEHINRKNKNAHDYRPSDYQKGENILDVTEAATDAARQWEGWAYGAQSLKPALEPIYMGQKPFSEATGSKNVMRWGVGAVNVDGCRVGTEGRPLLIGDYKETADNVYAGRENGSLKGGSVAAGETTLGRWPANLIHDGSDEVIAAFPDSDNTNATARVPHTGGVYGKHKDTPYEPIRDKGSNARFFAACPPEEGDKFFYCAKAPSSERAGSVHPTVKPLKLMRYLARLVTPPDGLVLDPFAGSGTTGEAAALEGLRAFLIDMSEDTARDLRARESR